MFPTFTDIERSIMAKMESERDEEERRIYDECMHKLERCRLEAARDIIRTDVACMVGYSYWKDRADTCRIDKVIIEQPEELEVIW